MGRTLRIAGWTVGAVLLLVILLIAVLLILGNTAGGRRLLERETASVTDGKIRLSGLSGSFPADLHLSQLQLSDEQGVWMTAQDATLRWSPLSLLASHINIHLLSVEQLNIQRRPATQSGAESRQRTSLPHTDLDQLRIGTLTLGPSLAGVPASLAVQGSAHLISMQDAKANFTARRTDGKGDYALALSFDPSRMDATLKLEEPAGGTLENLLHYPGLGALSVNASLNGPRSAEDVQLIAKAGDLNARLQGKADLTQKSADLSYSIESPAMAVDPRVSWQRVSVQGHWHGTIQATQADGRARIVGLRMPDGAQLAALDANLAGNRGALNLQATAEGLVVPGSAPRLFSDSPIRVNARMSLNEPTRPVHLTADHRLFALQADATTAGERHGTFELRLPELEPLAKLASQAFRGKAVVKGSMDLRPAATRVDVAADTELVPETASSLLALLNGSSKLQLAAVLTQQAVKVERLSLDAPKLSLSGTGHAERDTAPGATSAVKSVQAEYRVNLPDLSVLSAAAAGTLTLNGQVQGPARSMATQLHALADLSLRGSPREKLEANIKARGLPSLTDATLLAQGQLAGAPLHVDAALDRSAGGAVHISIHRAEWKSAHLQSDLTTVASLKTGHGSLQLHMDRLADLEPLLGTHVEGSLNSEVLLKPVGHDTYVQLRVDATHVAAADLSANAHLTASGPANALGLQLSVQSPKLGGQPASLDSGARLNLTARELRLERAEAHYHGQLVRLLSPARVSFAKGLAINQLKLGVQQALLALDGQISPTLDLRASLHHLDSNVINAFMPGMLSEGTLDAEATVRGTSAAPTGSMTATGTGLRLGSSAARDLAAIDVRTTARLMGQKAELDTQVTAGHDSRLTLKGSVPLNTNGNLNLKLTGKLDAVFLNPILEARGDRASGTLNMNLGVTGSPRAPQVQGTADLVKGDLRDYAQGLHLSDITAHLVASQGVLHLTNLTARAGQGQMKVTGTVGILQPQIPIDLQLSANNAQPITNEVLTAIVNADLQVKGTLRQRIDLTGTINPKRAVIGIPSSMPPDVAVLDVREPGTAPPPPPEQRLVIGLDLKLHAPREILVQGRGLDAELGGDLQMTGTADAPHIDGGFDMIRGTFKLVSTTLTFTKGRVSFNGAGLKHKIDPSIDFTAQATVSDATTTLRITGLADSPQFELSSTPALPQDEILARLLFGESASQLTALQIAEIGSALATLTGSGGGGFNPVAKVQKSLGLDRLSVGGGGNTGGTGGQSSGGATVEAGRYVTNRVYVGARESTTGFSQVEVDVDLTKHLKLQTRLGNGSANTQGTTPENDPGSSVGVLYQVEYGSH
jgi:translocation and assembly module TamB